ncbi:hypothetical protein, unlikely [Trypanosoma brucei gambiense DAL972]|uniref:Uncharacterized protein n=1 Tax=Trypanosoma brucei gambiense (strain MHOM/CI/86/DAL972) TaxID=679716 RepID=D0A0P4_TRYB9|nr:hypothetical protein, unlikely [Trypanosoma brucei gambiense DAL972]CBH16802.1 hypothetical protein, unlikely [Trypanosoma brucei gambiense DAL972]|eukprot:XP_011779066.1 hypothetical protein, unlikely [Trypanosoma brucei gambiense DAL972]
MQERQEKRGGGGKPSRPPNKRQKNNNHSTVRASEAPFWCFTIFSASQLLFSSIPPSFPTSQSTNHSNSNIYIYMLPFLFSFLCTHFFLFFSFHTLRSPLTHPRKKKTAEVKNKKEPLYFYFTYPFF